ncbi:MAG TPA: hypothetical protein VLM85_18080 [Polyangiaceae bacterium]|nr:hypothetical protein [Polyangiaceae bacterium]
MPTSFRAALFALAPVAFTFAVACSDNNNVPAQDAGKQECPTTIAQATASTTTCQVQNTICVVGFPCTPVYQQATCTCDTTAGWSCILSNGKAVAPDTTDTAPLCQAVGGTNPEQCPTTPAAGDGVACHTSGQICYYSGLKCTGDVVAHIDTCQCVANAAGDAGLSWACETTVCP